jgi:hypothetical protein
VRPVSLPKWPHPHYGIHLARESRLARASALLLMQLRMCSSFLAKSSAKSRIA